MGIKTSQLNQPILTLTHFYYKLALLLDLQTMSCTNNPKRRQDTASTEVVNIVVAVIAYGDLPGPGIRYCLSSPYHTTHSCLLADSTHWLGCMENIKNVHKTIIYGWRSFNIFYALKLCLDAYET